jgi:transcriptional regulator with XRE-family HTH domain
LEKTILNKKSFGRRVVQYREEAGYSQDQLAELIDVSKNFISYIERGIKMPSLENYVKLVNALNISSDILLAEEINNAYKAKSSLLEKKVESLPIEDKNRIFTIIEAFVKERK